MNTLMLSSKSYKESKEHDFGDCFISDNGNDVVVFDCGSNEHAEKVIEYLENKKALPDHSNGLSFRAHLASQESPYHRPDNTSLY